MKCVALFISHYTIDNSPSILNLIELISRNNQLWVFLEKVTHTSHPILQNHHVKVVWMHKWYPRLILSGAKEYLLNRWYLLNARRHSFDTLIACDRHGFLACLRLFPRSRPYYYCLELNLSYESETDRYAPAVSSEERSNIHRIPGLLIQSLEREDLFRKDYNLSSTTPVIHLPVTYQYPAIKQKSQYLRQVLPIGDRQRIILHLGGIAEWFSCLEFAKCLAQNKKYALVFHGFADETYKQNMVGFIERNGITNVFFTPATFQDLNGIDQVTSSADFGIAWYEPLNQNFITAGQSSGKIPAYLRAGLPVIGSHYPSFRKAIEYTGTGVCISEIDGIIPALETIEKDYASYVRNCHSEYMKTYYFANYEQRLLDFLNLAH